jgi:hypothetical protein
MTIEKILDDCANTIRQQEAALLAEQKHNEMLMAEIEALKKELKKKELQLDFMFKQEIKNVEIIK